MRWGRFKAVAQQVLVNDFKNEQWHSVRLSIEDKRLKVIVDG